MVILDFFNVILINPMINVLVLFYILLLGNLGLAIILFTVIVRTATLPLQMKQTKQMKAMTALMPRMREFQERYAKDPQRRSQETMRLYREAGVNPLGCLGPMFLQIPIWVGLYRALIKVMGTNPDDLIGLSQRLYSWNPVADAAVPLSSSFLGLNLANPDPTPILPVLVGITTFAQQKMTTMPTADPKQQSTNSMMLWMIPVMLGFFSLTFPSGLALYWVVSAVVGVAIQYFITRDLSPLLSIFPKSAPAPAPEPESQAAVESEPEEAKSDGRDGEGRDGDVRKNRRRSHRASAERAGRRPRRGRNRNSKPR